MEKKFNFVYLTTNLVNKKQYIGDHSTNDLNCYKTLNYLGSGKLTLHPAIKKYGRENFKREILEYFDTKQKAFDAQEKYIKLYKTHVSKKGYNISWKGGTGPLTEEMRKKNYKKEERP
jgi:group I intron endonuclease